MNKFKIEPKCERSTKWDSLLEIIRHIKESKEQVKIAIVGKYTGLQDSYLSVIKALEHAAINNNRELKISWVESENLNDQDHSDWTEIKQANGILVPGGFGVRGVEGKIKAIKYARENKIAFLGICLGMQLAVVEFCRNVVGMEKASHEEFVDTPGDHVIVFMPDISKTMKGGTMRLGAKHTYIKDPNSLASRIYYGKDTAFERHRHRYEVNIEHRKAMEDEGLIFSGEDSNQERMEILELADHPFFVGTQYHPEYTSRPFRPNPVFYAFVQVGKQISVTFIATLGTNDNVGVKSELELKYS